MTTQPPPPSPYLQPAGGPVGGAQPAPYDPTRYAAPAPGFDGPWGPLAGWGPRVGASVLDALVSLIGMVPYVIGIILVVVGAGSSGSSAGSDPTVFATEAEPTNTGLVIAGVVLVGIGVLLSLGIQLWNRVFRQGRTGQSIGKRVLGLRLLDERTGQPIGAGMAFVRELCHTLDGIAYIGYLWPLWDDKRQTFADKIIGTVVVRVPKP